MPLVTLVGSSPVPWHHDLAWAMLAVGFASALAIALDELRPGGRQQMWIMNVVHDATARELRRRGSSADPRDLRPWHVADATSHCGAGCTLGDIAGEWLVLELGIVWFGRWSGHQLPAELLLDFVLAWTLGILFQYFTLAPMRGESPLAGIWSAIKVDTASIVAFQVGLFGWMAIFMLVIWPHHGIAIASADFWFEMQVGMILGYLTSFPVNRWLVASGVKEKMDARRHLGMLVAELAAADERRAAA